MRLATLGFLIPALLGAQDAADLPWRAVERGGPPPAPPAVSAGTVSVHLLADGTLRIFEGKGLRTFRMGLPGRPVRVWRDGGVLLDAFLRPMGFPADTPLRRGLGSLPLDAADFRPALQGLLWILDDGERTLTLLHPATCQVVRLLLPDVEGADLQFLQDRLEVHGADGRTWALPWIALMPQFLQLGRPRKAAPLGSALQPYPKG